VFAIRVEVLLEVSENNLVDAASFFSDAVALGDLEQHWYALLEEVGVRWRTVSHYHEERSTCPRKVPLGFDVVEEPTVK